MNVDDLQQFAVPALVVGFLGWRFMRFRGVKSRMPELLKVGATIVDVRSPAEFSGGSHPQAINIPLGDIESRASSLDLSKPVVVCCASGTRSALAMGMLKRKGFKDVINAGPWQNTLGS